MKTPTAVKLVAAVLLAGGLATDQGAARAQQARKPAAAPQSKEAAASANHENKKADNYLGIITVDDAPPVIVETSPRSGANDVDPSLTELKITFSKDMKDGSWAWAQVSKGSFPQTTGKPHYLEDKRTNVLPVRLEPNRTYIIWLNKPPFDSFMDTDRRKAVPYLLVFQTKAG